MLVVRPREQHTKLLHYDGPFHVRKQLPGPEGRKGIVYVLALITGVDFVFESDKETFAAEESFESSNGLLLQNEFELLFGQWSER